MRMRHLHSNFGASAADALEDVSRNRRNRQCNRRLIHLDRSLARTTTTDELLCSQLDPTSTRMGRLRGEAPSCSPWLTDPDARFARDFGLRESRARRSRYLPGPNERHAGGGSKPTPLAHTASDRPAATESISLRVFVGSFDEILRVAV